MFVLLFGFLSQVVFSDGTALARAVRKGVFSTSAMSSSEIEMVSLAATRLKDISTN